MRSMVKAALGLAPTQTPPSRYITTSYHLEPHYHTCGSFLDSSARERGRERVRERDRDRQRQTERESLSKRSTERKYWNETPSKFEEKKMSSFSYCTVFLALIFIFQSTWAFPQSGHDSSGSRSRRSAPCGTNMSSLNNICCLNCPAGSHMTSPCTEHGEMMECKECDYGTFTEHSNDLKQCFKCAQCRSDQTIVRPCTETQDTECACKAGRFCAHDQACEVCKKCSRCEKDEVIVRNCTSTTNTECKKIQSTPPPSPVKTWLWLSIIASFTVGLIIVVGVLYWKYNAPDSQSSRPDGLKPGERNTEEGRNGNTRMPNFHNLESFPKLVPVNDESLQKCFDYFEEVDYVYHSRFFRHIGISDNVIKSKEHLHYVDRVHEVLNIWMEQKGREASLNDLLKALLNLNQRRTAEYIRLKVIEHGHYTECEKGLSEQFSDNM